MDRLRRVARAVADDDPALPRVAHTALQEIDLDVRRLKEESEAILKLLQVTQNSRPRPRLMERITPEIDLEAESKLTNTERQVITAVVEDALIMEAEPSMDALIATIEDRGVPIRDRVARPASVVGTILHFARKRQAAASNGTASEPKEVTAT
jgi:hypothetical protein